MAHSTDRLTSTSDSSSAASVLLAALKRDNAELDEHPEAYVEALAKLLAKSLTPGPTLAKRVRSLAYNLSRNQPLRRELLSGGVLAADVCAMDATEWAPAAVKRAREAAVERSESRVQQAMTGGELYSLTRSVRCSECGSNRARFKHTGTDMKDWHGRKNEVWGTKHDDDDGNDCLIECLACEHSWRGAAPEVHLEAEGDDFEQPRRKDAYDLDQPRRKPHGGD